MRWIVVLVCLALAGTLACERDGEPEPEPMLTPAVPAPVPPADRFVITGTGPWLTTMIKARGQMACRSEVRGNRDAQGKPGAFHVSLFEDNDNYTTSLASSGAVAGGVGVFRALAAFGTLGNGGTLPGHTIQVIAEFGASWKIECVLVDPTPQRPQPVTWY